MEKTCKGKWGSTYIDDYFIEKLELCFAPLSHKSMANNTPFERKLISNHFAIETKMGDEFTEKNNSNWISEFRILHPDVFVEFMNGFNLSKNVFYENWKSIVRKKKKGKWNPNKKYLNIAMPSKMSQFLSEKIEKMEGFEGDDIEEYFAELTVHGEKLSLPFLFFYGVFL